METKKEVKNNKFNLKENKKMFIFYIAIGLFILNTILIFTHVTDPLDSIIESFVIGIRNDKLTHIMIDITNLSRAYFLIAISIILLFVLKNKKNSLLIILNLITAFSTSQILKFIFRRGRPDGDFLIDAFGYSYPSGHAMVSTAYFGFIIYLINKRIKNKFLKITLTILISITIFLIGFSRIYLGVHYASDVLSGFIMACAYLMMFLTIIDNKGAK